MSKRDKRVYLALTEGQRKAIGKLELQSIQAAEDGKPGMVVAQIVAGEMRVQFIPHNRAAPMLEAMGGDASKRISGFDLRMERESRRRR